MSTVCQNPYMFIVEHYIVINEAILKVTVIIKLSICCIIRTETALIEMTLRNIAVGRVKVKALGNGKAKIKVIAALNKRSIAAQIEYLLEQCINGYEAEHGAIVFSPISKSRGVVQDNSGDIKNKFLSYGGRNSVNHNMTMNKD